MSQHADFHEDRDSAWLLGLADAVAAEMVTTREVALDRMAIIFAGAAAGTGRPWTDSPFRAARTIVDLERAGRLCEHLAERQRAAPAGNPPTACPTCGWSRRWEVVPGGGLDAVCPGDHHGAHDGDAVPPAAVEMSRAGGEPLPGLGCD
jgi:hypothetical protein